MYLLFVGAQAEHSQWAAGRATGCRLKRGGGAGLRRWGGAQRLIVQFVPQGGGEVVFNLLSLGGLDVIPCWVLQVCLNLQEREMVRLVNHQTQVKRSIIWL
jgi:hypothetical protein